MAVVYLEKVVFFYDFRIFGGIRSTQPTSYVGVFSKIDTYVSVGKPNRTYPNRILGSLFNSTI